MKCLSSLTDFIQIHRAQFSLFSVGLEVLLWVYSALTHQLQVSWVYIQYYLVHRVSSPSGYSHSAFFVSTLYVSYFGSHNLVSSVGVYLISSARPQLTGLSIFWLSAYDEPTEKVSGQKYVYEAWLLPAWCLHTISNYIKGISYMYWRTWRIWGQFCWFLRVSDVSSNSCTTKSSGPRLLLILVTSTNKNLHEQAWNNPSVLSQDKFCPIFSSFKESSLKVHQYNSPSPGSKSSS